MKTPLPLHAGTFPLLVDVVDAAAALTVTADLPGVKKSDLKVEVSADGVFTIAATRPRPAATAADADAAAGDAPSTAAVRRERPYGAFSRRLRLPAGARPDGISARLDAGVLVLTVPKEAPAPGPQPFRVEILDEDDEEVEGPKGSGVQSEGPAATEAAAPDVSEGPAGEAPPSPAP